MHARLRRLKWRVCSQEPCVGPSWLLLQLCYVWLRVMKERGRTESWLQQGMHVVLVEKELFLPPCLLQWCALSLKIDYRGNLKKVTLYINRITYLGNSWIMVNVITSRWCHDLLKFTSGFCNLFTFKRRVFFLIAPDRRLGKWYEGYRNLRILFWWPLRAEARACTSAIRSMTLAKVEHEA